MRRCRRFRRQSHASPSQALPTIAWATSVSGSRSLRKKKRTSSISCHTPSSQPAVSAPLNTQYCCSGSREREVLLVITTVNSCKWSALWMEVHCPFLRHATFAPRQKIFDFSHGVDEVVIRQVMIPSWTRKEPKAMSISWCIRAKSLPCSRRL